MHEQTGSTSTFAGPSRPGVRRRWWDMLDMQLRIVESTTWVQNSAANRHRQRHQMWVLSELRGLSGDKTLKPWKPVTKPWNPEANIAICGDKTLKPCCWLLPSPIYTSSNGYLQAHGFSISQGLMTMVRHMSCRNSDVWFPLASWVWLPLVLMY